MKFFWANCPTCEVPRHITHVSITKSTPVHDITFVGIALIIPTYVRLDPQDHFDGQWECGGCDNLVTSSNGITPPPARLIDFDLLDYQREVLERAREAFPEDAEAFEGILNLFDSLGER